MLMVCEVVQKIEPTFNQEQITSKHPKNVKNEMQNVNL